MKDTVFVGNVSFNTDKNSLENVFSQCGNIIEVSIPVDRETRRPRGFAFVKFDSEEGAQKALSLDGQLVDGRNIKVSQSRGKQ